MSRALVESVAARIEHRAFVAFRGEVPDKMLDGSPIPQHYYVVRSNIGTDESVDLGDSRSLRGATVWITSVGPDFDSCLWGAELAHAQLKNWRPSDTSWKPVPLASQPPTDNSSPSIDSWEAVETWGFQFQP